MRLLNGLQLSEKTAIVLPSPKLIESGLGLDIDKHESVIRFNDSLGKGNRNDVGEKTTHWFAHEGHLLNKIPPDYIKQVALNCNQWHPNLPLGCLIPNILAIICFQVQYSLSTWPSTGLFAIKAAIEYGIKPNVFGFEREWQETYGYYYATETKPTVRSGHNYLREKEIVNQWAKEKLIYIND